MKSSVQAQAEHYYAFYTEIKKKIETSEKGVGSLTFDELNELYNIILRAKADSLIFTAISQCDALCDSENLHIIDKINRIIDDYSSAHGVDIRDELYEIKTATGVVYFKAQTDKPPHTYRLGDSITFHVTLRDKETRQIACCDTLEYAYEIEGVEGKKQGTADGKDGMLTVTVPSEEILASSFVKDGESKGIMIRLAVSAVGVENQEKFLGGAVVDMEKLRMDAKKPDDFDEYWAARLAECTAVCPIDTTLTPYTRDGVVISDIRRDGDTFSREKGKLISEENYFHTVKIDKKRLQHHHKKGLSLPVTEERLDEYDCYEVYLKSPGACPSTLSMSIPKNVNKSAQLVICFDGYSAHAPALYVGDKNIILHVSHHGYWVDASDEEVYNSLNKGEHAILYCYGKANGEPNSDYRNPDDNYILYMFLRDLQALRFATELPQGKYGDSFDDETLSVIYESLRASWNGETRIMGVSMGGYQAIATAALAAMLGIPVKEITPSIPGFCNLSGRAVGGRFDTIFGMKYDPVMPYIDAVPLAEYVTADTEILRCSLGDYTCPPAGVIAAYNAMKCKKKMRIYQNSTHGYVPADTDIFVVE